MYKIELHLHTPIVSCCGKVAPEEIVRRYKQAGYAGITVTDHYHMYYFQDPGKNLDTFLEGYRQVKAIAEEEGLAVYYGAELRFTENSNDYLLYGFREELLTEPEQICRMGIAAFSELARENGALLIQAHPFRKGCVPVAPYLVDGVEAINRHDVHDNKNHLAMAFADRYGMRKISSGDFHDPEDRCIAGIGADFLPADSFALAELLRSGNFRLLGGADG